MMIARHARPILPFLFMVLPIGLHAQVPAPGQWVRVQVYESRVEGRLARIDSDSVILEEARAGANRPIHLALLRADVAGMWLSTGYTRRTLAGMGYGLLGGAALGALVGAATAGPCREFICFTAETPGEGALIYGAAFGALGLVTGGISGALSRRHEWTEVDLGPPPPVAPVPHLNFGVDRGRPVVEVRLAF